MTALTLIERAVLPAPKPIPQHLGDYLVLVGLAGKKGSGKDTAVASLVSDPQTRRIAFADGVRDALEALNPYVLGTERLNTVLAKCGGWEAMKTTDAEFEARRLRQYMGANVGRTMFGANVWVDLVAQKIRTSRRDGYTTVVVPDVRYSNEAELIVKLGGVLVLVVRDGVDTSDSHDTETIDFKTDYVLRNTSGVEDLQQAMSDLLDNTPNAQVMTYENWLIRYPDEARRFIDA